MGRPLHADLEALGFLLGRWNGSGEGVWPPGEPFAYGEEMTFEHVGDPFLLFAERSWSLDDGSPLHFERGFVRPGPDGGIEMTLAHPLGLCEVAEGTLAGRVVDVTAVALPTTRTGSPVTGLRRRLEVVDGVLRYELWMAMRDEPLARHLAGELKRESPAA